MINLFQYISPNDSILKTDGEKCQQGPGIPIIFAPLLPLDATPIISGTLKINDKYLAISEIYSNFASDFKIE